MQTAQLTQCTDCGTLKDLYDKLICSIYQLIKNKWRGRVYNIDSYFNDEHYKTLLRLKAIVYKRLYTPTYPCDNFSTQDIISLVVKNLYKSNSCPDCPCEDFTDFITTTTTTITP